MKNSSKIKVGIIGLGMVGEPVRKWFEELNGYKKGRDLFCYDADPKKSYKDDVNRADVIFVSVPTPSNPDGSCNTSIVESVVGQIKDPDQSLSADRHSKKGRALGGAGGKIVVIKSTVEPGTVQRLQDKYPKKRFIFNPEFLTESQSWEDFISPDRQIVSTTSKSEADAVEILNLLPRKNFIRPWTSDYSKRSVNTTEAEMGKYASNVFGFLKVAYGNILADLAHAMTLKYAAEKKKTAVNYDNLKDLIAADLRIGPAWLNVNHGNYCGAGGYCFPKDMAAFIAFADSLAEQLKKSRLPKGNRGSSAKSGIDPAFMKVLKKGVGVLKAAEDYNVELLKAQGLSVDDVSKHNKEIILQKRKEIRK